MKYVYSVIFSVLIAVLLVSCGSSSQSVTVKNTTINDSLLIKHVYEGKTNENVYSVAHYRTNQWLLAVSDTTLLVLDARDGSFVKNVGRLSKPSVIKVNGGLLYLLDKGQEMIQSIILPSFLTSGILAGGKLNKPIDLTIFASDVNKTSYFVTHLGDTSQVNSVKLITGAGYFALNETTEDMVNPTSRDLSGPGVVYKPGAIEVDPTMANIAIVEESEFPNSIKFFDLNGNFDPGVRLKMEFTGKIPDMDLYYCQEGKGYWLIAQNTELGGKSASITLVDRMTYEIAGELYFEDIDEIRSISSVQSRIGTNIGGLLYIVNSKGKVYGYPWEKIKNALKLKHFCEFNR